MVDNFIKGETFDGETGYKTGAQLEDLTTQAQQNQNDSGGNRNYDNVTIDTIANPDATGRMLQVKDASIGATQFAGGAFIYPRLTLLGGVGDWGGTLGFTSWGTWQSSTDPDGEDWANVIDQDVTTFPTTALQAKEGRFDGSDDLNPYTAGDAGVYVDLGAVYAGKFLIALDMKSSSATSGNNVYANMAYGQATTDLTDSDFVPPGMCIGYGSETAYRPTLGLLDFTGRYVGFCLGSIGSGFTGTFNISRFEVYGVAL